MKRNILHTLFLSAFLSLVCVSCQKPAEESVSPHGKITFTLSGTAPIVAYPEDNVHYGFSVSYGGGLKSVGTYVDGILVEGSLAEFTDSPEQADYSFNYSVSSAQIGQTIDFVFRAECADGYSGSVDYPVYVRSISDIVTVTLPEEHPTEAIVGDKLHLDITVSAGYSLAKIRVLKNDAELPGLTKTSGFKEAKADIFAFDYTVGSADASKELVFVVEATDSKGNFGTAEFKLMAYRGQPKVLYSDIFDTSMKISNTSEFDTSVGGVSGTSASEFIPATIARYNGDDPDVTVGVKEGMTVLGGDKTGISYDSDGTDICLSKYNYSAMKQISGTYLWARKGKKGWISVSGIQLHDCTTLNIFFSQCGGSVKVEWSADGTNWTEICQSSATDTVSKDFTVPDGTDDITIRFTENGSAHLRFDNIVLKGA